MTITPAHVETYLGHLDHALALDARFAAVRAVPEQIGGVARAADPCPIAYTAR